jgi:trimeric autotransporter adhesin
VVLRRRMLACTMTVMAAMGGLLIAPPVSAVDFSTSPDPVQTWVPNGRVYDILHVRNRVYIAGTFSNVRNMNTGQRVARNRLAAFNATTGAVLDWNPGANDTVRALAASADGNTVYVGGHFGSVGGAARDAIAAIDRRTGAVLRRFRANADDWVRDLLVIGNDLFAAGAFGNVNGVGRRFVAKLDGATGAVDGRFTAGLAGGRAFALDGSGDGRLVIGGKFVSVGGAPIRYLTAVSTSNGNPSPWSPSAVCDGCLLLDVAVQDGVAYAAVGGPGGGRAAAWRLDRNARLWSRHADGDVQAVDVYNGFAYFGGHFGPRFDNRDAHQLVALSTGSGTLQSYRVPFVGTDKPGIWAVDASAGHLRLGGSFQGIGSSGRAARYAVLPAR